MALETRNDVMLDEKVEINPESNNPRNGNTKSTQDSRKDNNAPKKGSTNTTNNDAQKGANNDPKAGNGSGSRKGSK